MNEEKDKRTRINFKTSVKGIVTPDVTLEMINSTNDSVIVEMEDLYSKAKKLADVYTEMNKTEPGVPQ